LIPDDDHSYDLVGVPELVAEEPDSWTIGELAEIVNIVRSLADVCELDEVHEVLDAHEGFSLLQQGRLPFTGREGAKLWDDLATAVAEKGAIVREAIDELVVIPEIDEAVLDETAEELAAFHEESAESEAGVDDDALTGNDDDIDTVDSDDDEETEDDESLGFWGEVGIDPIKIVTRNAEYYTLRCYLDDEPVFLGKDGKIDVFTSPRALARQLADAKELGENDM